LNKKIASRGKSAKHKGEEKVLKYAIIGRATTPRWGLRLLQG